MKNVGIITYQDIADGKGRFLQAYALYEAIKMLGYDVEIIDYYPFTMEEKAKPISKKILQLLKNPILLPGYIAKLQMIILNKFYRNELSEKRRKYEAFIKENIRITNTKYYGYESILESRLDYNAFVCGSDQIWNPYFQGMDSAYYLQFAPKEKRIAYAPSLGTIQISDEIKNVIKSKISEIPFVSVREESGARLVSELIRRDVKAVLDPTLIMSPKWWNEFAGDIKPDKPYVLAFLFDNSIYPRKVAKQIAKKYAYDIICIPDSFADIFLSGRKEISIGPEKFINLFKNAAFICTQSFHGTILSLIFNKPFYVFDRKTKAYVSGVFSRINDLLIMVELEERILKEGQGIPANSLQIDYRRTNEILKLKRKESMEFLKNSLQQAIGRENNVIGTH